MEDPHSPTSRDHESLAWIDQWIAPPHGDEVRKLFSALGKVSDASPYLTRVKRYVVDGPLRNELGISLYDATIWGQIRWRRSRQVLSWRMDSSSSTSIFSGLRNGGAKTCLLRKGLPAPINVVSNYHTRPENRSKTDERTLSARNERQSRW